MKSFLTLSCREEINHSYFMEKKCVERIFRIRNSSDSEMLPAFSVVFLLMANFSKLAESSTSKQKLTNDFIAQRQPRASFKGLGDNVVLFIFLVVHGSSMEFCPFTFTVRPKAKLNTSSEEISKEIHETTTMAGWLLVK